LPDIPISNVTLTNVHLTAPTGMEINFATGVSIVNSSVKIASTYDAQYAVSVPEPASSFGLIIATATSLLTARRWGRRLAD
jgi:hypothetical protein